ncbi:urea carboxylase [Pelagicoccus sp. SDUM812003]|uniref:urea carboxylase n=1 Tax=Pelagicoccus sp. SDUM812003 TaxID=3041267 RepID=UPI00280C71D9|nr:urea carboxylase [Pelagicoccus sp. SDUM812003]MDQ8202090.1 urea carboxylase [Pelagicoccus sp. SDUM812003]
MFTKVLIANRGEIACRIIKTLRKMGVTSVAIYSDADKFARHVELADEAIHIGPAPVKQSYLNTTAILQAAKSSGAQAIHPGYGLLSENADFATAVEKAGLVFIGPTPEQMIKFGLKHTARELAIANNAPLLPGSDLLDTLDDAKSEADRIGYPVMLKSTAGGGGIGMTLCWSKTELIKAYDSVKRLGENNFANAGIFLEKFVQRARHIEAQVFGDGKGKVIALGERDCSVQRRNQKVIEETPAPAISQEQRTELLNTAVRLAKAVNYRSAGTVEFVYDVDASQFYFLEVNTRLQVEHCVTEEVTGVDLVQWMIELAAQEMPDLDTLKIIPSGSAIQARVYAEDPNKTFQPSSGLLTEVRFPDSVRVDTWIETSTEVSPYYDPLLAKIIVKADNRSSAIDALASALADSRVEGIETNLEYLENIVASDVFNQALHTTKFCDSLKYEPHSIDVIEAGTQTTVQDYPGRVGYWDIGVPPSGPFDSYAFRMGNKLLGNPDQAAGLEITVTGPTLVFNHATTIALTGAPTNATLNGESVPFWTPIQIKAGDELATGKITENGCRAYLAVQGGLDVPDYLGSKSTFTLGQFGGHCGRTLMPGDVLHFNHPALGSDEETRSESNLQALEETLPSQIPNYGHHWEIRVLYGPHGAPDFFTDEDIETFFDTRWEVHYNSARTGVRLIGPKPKWARADGGEAGLHPSNIHDNAYAIGAIDFTGDMPVILGPDGPSLGGFVCPATIIKADLWMMGQLKPGDTIRFTKVDQTTATRLEAAQEQVFQGRAGSPSQPQFPSSRYGTEDAILETIPEQPVLDRPSVCYRRSGDKYLLVEYGEMKLDLNLRFRAHALMEAVKSADIPGILELTPGIRSLQIHYESLQIPLDELVDKLKIIEDVLPPITEMTVPTRTVWLPLSWDDEATQLAIKKYESVRKNAPWCPSNIEFIRRINGLDSIQDVKDILFNASYLVMGLGDVYLGAPVATPVDPRHRLVTTKYNPARTWTPENAVGIGGAYLCVYGMEGPGGYQFVGRTVQMWNRYKQTKDFKEGKPWLLRFFDQIRFYEVSAKELLKMREDFIHGRFELKVEESEFNLADYNRFLADNDNSIKTFKAKQQAAFDAERQRWIETGQATFVADESAGALAVEDDIPEGCSPVQSHVPGSVWKICVQEGDKVKKGDTLLVVESMKMEINLTAPTDATVEKLLAEEGSPTKKGQTLAILRT